MFCEQIFVLFFGKLTKSKVWTESIWLLQTISLYTSIDITSPILISHTSENLDLIVH